MTKDAPDLKEPKPDQLHLAAPGGEHGLVQEADARDAARYRWLRSRVNGHMAVNNRGRTVPAFGGLFVEVPEGMNIMRGSVAQHIDAAIDEAMSKGTAT